MKKGFTIVELLTVIGIIFVLMGIITTAASQSIKSSRSRRADALCHLVQAGYNAYYAQNDRWPGDVGRLLQNGSLSPRNNQEDGGQNDENKYVLNGGEVKSSFLDMIEEAKQGRPVMDISGLFVSRDTGELKSETWRDGRHYAHAPSGYGLDFMSAIRGTKQSPKKMKTSEMYFGYPDPETGHFIRFKIVYSIPAGQFTVSKHDFIHN